MCLVRTQKSHGGLTWVRVNTLAIANVLTNPLHPSLPLPTPAQSFA